MTVERFMFRINMQHYSCNLGPKSLAMIVATIEERGQMLSTYKYTMTSPRLARSCKVKIDGPFRDWLTTAAKLCFCTRRDAFCTVQGR